MCVVREEDDSLPRLLGDRGFHPEDRQSGTGSVVIDAMLPRRHCLTARQKKKNGTNSCGTRVLSSATLVHVKHWEKCSCHCESPQETLEDWATVGPCCVCAQRNRTGSIGLRCQPWSGPGGWCMLPTRRPMLVCCQACPQTSSA